MIFLDAKNKPNGAGADNWLGASFWNSNYTYGDKSFAPQGINNLTIDNARGKLFVGDGFANRIMQFAASGTLTGIQNTLINDNSIHCCPNPAHDFVKITAADRIERVTALDLSGKTIGTMQPDSENNLNVSRLPNGVYFLRVETTQGTKNVKLIKK